MSLKVLLIGVLIILLTLFLLFVFTGRNEYYINSGNLEYKKKFYCVGVLVKDKIEQTKLSEFIRKNNFFRESHFVQVNNYHHSATAIPFSEIDHCFKLFEKYLIPLYEKKLIDKNETIILINSMMDFIEKKETLRIGSFVGAFLKKYENTIVENLDYEEPVQSKNSHNENKPYQDKSLDSLGLKVEE